MKPCSAFTTLALTDVTALKDGLRLLVTPTLGQLARAQWGLIRLQACHVACENWKKIARENLELGLLETKVWQHGAPILRWQ